MTPSAPTLTAAQAAAVRRLAGLATAADRVAPLNEAAQLALTSPDANRTSHWLAGAPDAPQGYAQLDHRDGSVQLFVEPGARRRGLGRTLAEAVLADGRARTWWAFGDLPAAAALASALGMVPVRGLLKMSLELDGAQLPAPSAPPAGLQLDHFRQSDLDRLVAVNAEAFADHPEQGALTAADFRARMAQPWFEDTDLLVARDRSGQLVGYHWTKLEDSAAGPVGEVYVLGVDPAHAGRGAGRALLEAGIMHMRQRGATRVDLYVEAANHRVVDMYRTAGFVTTHTDVAYGHVEENR